KYRLNPNPRTPYNICKQQKLPYEKKACHDQMNGYVSRSYDTFSEALRVASRNADPQYMEVSILSLATSEASLKLVPRTNKNGKMKTADVGECAMAGEVYQHACAKGFGAGLVEMGDPRTGYATAISICAQGGRFSDKCLEGVSLAAGDWASDRVQAEVCRDIRKVSPSAGDRCDTQMHQNSAP
ncbi:MAG: hypothetical protein RIQ56_661, partial [Candidatus Parcubacteria bacterium]